MYISNIKLFRNSVSMQKNTLMIFNLLGFSLKDLFRGSEDLKNDYIKIIFIKVSLKKKKENMFIILL